MLNRVTATVEKYGLLEKGDSVIVALSGGADSTALLSVFVSLKEKYNLSIYAAHINHNIRGDEAKRDENFCKILCKKFNTELFIKSVDVPTLAKQQKISEELCGRNVRYAFFEELSQKLCAKIATAHTASDNAETLIFNIARGASLTGLSAIPPKRGNIIRPLIELSRGDIESYCEENNLEYVTDSTNLADDYTRNYIRHNIIPCLKKLNPSFERTALGLSENAGESAAFIKKCAEKAMRDCKGDFGYDCKKLLSLDSAVLKEMLFILLKNNCNISPERKTILLLCEIIRNGGSVELSKQCTAVSKQGILRFVCPKNSPDFNEIPLKNNMTFSYDGKIYTVNEVTEKVTNQNNLVSKKRLGENPVFRTCRAGDRFTYPDRMVTKPLRKVFNEQKIPSEMRDRLLLLAVSNTVLWCEKLGVSLQGKADDTEKNRKITHKYRQRGLIMHKDIEKILYSEKDIENIVNTIAKQIEKDYNDKDFIMVGLLKGSVAFMVDLMRKVNLDFSIDFIVASSYGSGTVSSGRVNIQKDISQSVEGKDILIVEDIIDSGNTLDFITKYLKAKKAKSVKLCTLFNKPDRRVADIHIDYAGAVIPDEFIVGYGLDYDEKYRNLPYVGVLKPSVYS